MSTPPSSRSTVAKRGVDLVRLTDVGPMKDTSDRLRDFATGVLGHVDHTDTGAFRGQALGRRLCRCPMPRP